MSPPRALTANLLSLLPATPSLTLKSLLSSPSPSPKLVLSLIHSPALNLSLEHYLFTSLPPSVPHCLLYTNGPSVIIGRNQNPFLELSASCAHPFFRRRSGGGTVYHDLGNLNYSVTVPTSQFRRDKHAEMVARALQGMGAAGARVNERWDIETAGMKVSGSAYKLTRLRSYHHGTLLCESDLGSLKGALRSRLHHDVVSARGVPSVPSSVTNLALPVESVAVAVAREWEKMYGSSEIAYVSQHDAESVEGIRCERSALESPSWRFGQTPRFVITLPHGAGEMAIDKGVVVECGDEAAVGKRFGREVVEAVLKRQGYRHAEDWVRDRILDAEEWRGEEPAEP